MANLGRAPRHYGESHGVQIDLLDNGFVARYKQSIKKKVVNNPYPKEDILQNPSVQGMLAVLEGTWGDKEEWEGEGESKIDRIKANLRKLSQGMAKPTETEQWVFETREVICKDATDLMAVIDSARVAAAQTKQLQGDGIYILDQGAPVMGAYLQGFPPSQRLGGAAFDVGDVM
jgi:hypothetical protein